MSKRLEIDCVLTLEQVRNDLQARQLESLVRLAEARARVELSQTVTAEHAQVDSLMHAPSVLAQYPLSAAVSDTVCREKADLREGAISGSHLGT